jgi:hypothetical protein
MSKRPPRQPEPTPATRRGDPEVVAKRRAARLFNDVVLGRRPGASDGRTERRRRRLLEELSSGTSRAGRALTPIDVLTRVQQLLELGAPLAEIRRACPPPASPPPTPELVERLRLLQEAYGFTPEVYTFIGLRGATLRKAGIAQVRAPGRRGAA